MTGEHDRRQAIERLSKLIHDIPIAMLTTCAADHSLRSRPMVNVNSKFDGDLWFFTHKKDPKVQEIVGNPQVNVAFAATKEGRYVSVSGAASLVEDPKRSEVLWTDACREWFPDGPEDPQLALLKIDVEFAELWDERTGGMSAIAGFVKKIASGEDGSYKHEKIDWQPNIKTPGVDT